MSISPGQSIASKQLETPKRRRGRCRASSSPLNKHNFTVESPWSWLGGCNGDKAAVLEKRRIETPTTEQSRGHSLNDWSEEEDVDLKSEYENVIMFLLR
jgi:hypothetical protein